MRFVSGSVEVSGPLSGFVGFGYEMRAGWSEALCGVAEMEDIETASIAAPHSCLTGYPPLLPVGERSLQPHNSDPQHHQHIGKPSPSHNSARLNRLILLPLQLCTEYSNFPRHDNTSAGCHLGPSRTHTRALRMLSSLRPEVIRSILFTLAIYFTNRQRSRTRTSTTATSTRTSGRDHNLI